LHKKINVYRETQIILLPAAPATSVSPPSDVVVVVAEVFTG
jgi:hypothetical protein